MESSERASLKESERGKYEYLAIESQTLPHTLSPLTGRYTRELFSDELTGPVEKSNIVRAWEIFRFILLALLFPLPFFLLSWPEIKQAWSTSLFGLLACCLPSGGAPIAGGIVFIPALQMLGVSPKQCVAFCSVTQAFGCGIFAPLNWIAKDPGIIIKNSLITTLPSGMLGLFLALFVFPVNESDVNYIFAYFCIFLLVTVIYGLQHDLTTQDEPLKFLQSHSMSITILTFLLYIIGGLVGGMLVGWIGIGIEKVFFLLATSFHKAELRRATVTAIFVVGLLSSVSAASHLFIFRDVPIPFWICGLPGVLLGSIIGPSVNAYLGSKNVMIVFCVFLVFNIAFDLSKSL